MESNERYYRRRAVEERMAAQRAVTETARTWHAKLAEDFAARAINAHRRLHPNRRHRLKAAYRRDIAERIEHRPE